jgi:ATP phosphoribosyltransferase
MAGLGGAVEILVLVQSDQILELLQAGPTLHRRNPIDAIYLI